MKIRLMHLALGKGHRARGRVPSCKRYTQKKKQSASGKWRALRARAKLDIQC